MYSTLAVLSDARDLISDRNRWCRFALATNALGGIVEVEDPEARRFCALGSIALTARRDHTIVQEFEAVNRLQRACVELWNRNGIDIVNDCDMLGHDAIMQAFDHAIATLEAEIGAAVAAKAVRRGHVARDLVAA